MAIYDKLILNNCHVKGLCGKNIRQYLGIITGCNIFADMRNLFVTIVFILPWYVAMAQEVNDLVSSGHDVDGIVADGTMRVAASRLLCSRTGLANVSWRLTCLAAVQHVRQPIYKYVSHRVGRMVRLEPA